MSNASRFISAYNELDKALRVRFRLKSNLTFSEAVRISASKNAVVRKYQDDLTDFAQLRNAIVHKSNTDMVIAEPHLSVVETIEHICELVSRPPVAIGTVANQAVILRGDTTLKSAIKVMAGGGYSNMPVIDGGKITGVLNNKIVVEAINKNIDDVDGFLFSARVCDLPIGVGDHYKIMHANSTVDDVLVAFDERKLLIVILTDNGTESGKILGVVTSADVVKMNRLLD